MKRLSALVAVAALAATLTAVPASDAVAQKSARRPAAVQDWTRVAARTPEGGFRMGNPNARVKVVEYLSLTCPHCAEFAQESHAGMLNHVRSGRVSIEYRHYFLNGLDVSASLLARCATPVNYFGMVHTLFATQPTWIGRTRTVTEQQRQALSALSPLQVSQRLVPLLGLDVVGQRFGVTAAMRPRCMTQAALNQLEQMKAAGEARGVQGTPSFFINGVPANTNTWAGIEPLLR